MTLYIKKLIWDDWNTDHIARHNVKPDEVEEVCQSRFALTKGRRGTYRIFGQTFSGRLLTIIVAPRIEGCFYIITARDSDYKEKRLFKRLKI